MVPEEELPVLESLVHIRNRLTALKKDRTEYIRAKDVLAIYGSLMSEVTRLNEIRARPKPSTSGEGAKDEPVEVEENRVDTILNDVFQLLSLFFLRIGKSRESPAAFCQLGTMKRLLTHLNESGIYTEADLKPYQSRLAELKEIINEGRTPLQGSGDPTEMEHDAAMNKLLLHKWDVCDRLVKKLASSLSSLSVELYPIHQRLITLRRSLASIAARPRPSINDVQPILAELRTIEDKRKDGKFVVEKPPAGSGDFFAPEKGQELLAGLLQDNFDICEDIKAREGEDQVARGPLQPIYDRLSEIRAQLERLVLTHRWTLRETDLYNYQNELARVDALRVDGKFRDADGNVPEGQLVLLYLLRRCYGLCYRLMVSSEPVSEELMPIANKLNTIKRCLIEVAKQGGPFTARDLYPFQLALYQIDSLRKDGKFEGRDGSIPEGQAILNALLSETHELVSMLQEEQE
ncbi:hypothetical protein NBRC10512_008171 [Rhodotorula toruloides]|uniref:RHTO0S04e08196g1_1 n=2 Tax=Rhodotorula toruloides TaxID=5286 RepID=A0A061AQ72_RHOTO|nr:protein of uncharacterized protein family UPF0662 [Rhodotorula toruloides NP11]EMS21237.1 protein of uncharacterized protein family UPF0662 [Rhodotorula toruloides NP11]KAJ8293788.1 UPF0662 protein C30C2.08 [Rhodotorula toruloides]CDR39715.1 RHTO0S04e08196g1_1 [Rhodotorula toruloides]